MKLLGNVKIYWEVFSIVAFSSVLKTLEKKSITLTGISKFHSFMCGSCHIRNVLIGVEYGNWCQTLDVYLLFAILLLLKTKLQTCNLQTGHVNQFWLNLPQPNSKTVNKHPMFNDNFDIWCQYEHFEYNMNRTLVS